jgi:cell wall-associated NlpC family hydrolase
MSRTPAGLVAHARAQLGLPYFYGTYGQKPTAELIDYKRRQYPDMWSLERVSVAKQKHLSAPRCYDCAGLVKSYWMQENPQTPARYVEKYDKSAGGLKSCCSTRGPISSIPESGSPQKPQLLWGDSPGVLVFVGTRHVGIYAGAGRVLEAKGFSYGVVETELRRGSWDTWGKLDWLDYGNAPKPAEPAKPTGTSDCGYFTHVVKEGDTLWALASRHLGSGYRWTEIQALNGGIDPRKLRIGMTLKIPKSGGKRK